VVPLFIPALRNRREDIVPLALELMKRYNKELKKNFAGLTPAAAELLTQYPWPGNIRELKNVIERTMILSEEGEIEESSLPEEICDYQFHHTAEQVPSAVATGPEGHTLVSLRELEQRYIHEVLASTGNNKAQAARILGIHPTSLMRKLKREDSE
jgi:transcriptional regulator with PAS, ATPase and Fis domain